MHAWEFHPQLVAFPLAFFLGGMVVDLWAARRASTNGLIVARGMLTAGLVMAALAAVTGLLAFFTLPEQSARTQEAIFWHAGLAAVAVVGFLAVVIARWRKNATPGALRGLGVIAAVLIGVAGHLGGRLVFREGVGVQRGESTIEEHLRTSSAPGAAKPSAELATQDASGVTSER